MRDANGQALTYIYIMRANRVVARQLSCSARMGRDALLPTWQSCRSYCASLNAQAIPEGQRIEATWLIILIIIQL